MSTQNRTPKPTTAQPETIQPPTPTERPLTLADITLRWTASLNYEERQFCLTGGQVAQLVAWAQRQFPFGNFDQLFPGDQSLKPAYIRGISQLVFSIQESDPPVDDLRLWPIADALEALADRLDVSWRDEKKLAATIQVHIGPQAA